MVCGWLVVGGWLVGGGGWWWVVMGGWVGPVHRAHHWIASTNQHEANVTIYRERGMRRVRGGSAPKNVGGTGSEAV